MHHADGKNETHYQENEKEGLTNEWFRFSQESSSLRRSQFGGINLFSKI